MLALLVGTLLAVGALAYVLFPLLFGVPMMRQRPSSALATMDPIDDEAVVALREIEFDRATGKLSDLDYDELKARYTERALALMRAVAVAPNVDAIEAAVSAYRSRLKRCARCGPRPEVDALYCSSCGSYLPGACESCGAKVTEAGAAFCTSCGRQFAA